MNTTKAFTYGIALGAGFMYVLDPRQGGGRRALIRDKSLRAVHEVERAAEIGVRDLTNRAEGFAARLRALGRERAVPPEVLVERVRAALGKVCSHPHAIRVAVNGDGHVELSGPVLADEIDHVLETIVRVHGVRAVDDALELHETPGMVPGLQGGVLRRPRRSQLAPAAKLAVGATAAGITAISLVAGQPFGLLAGGGLALALARSVASRRPLLTHHHAPTMGRRPELRTAAAPAVDR